VLRPPQSNAKYAQTEVVHATAVKLIAEELVCKVTISGRGVRDFFQQATKRSNQSQAYRWPDVASL
jgi:hypothetical protein